MKKMLFVIVLLGLILRLYGINWDIGFHLHPDERELIMVADKVHFWDQLNPNFFNYGSLPIYLLKGTSQLLDFIFNTHLATYDGMLIVGRALSTVFDLGTLVFIFLIAKKLFKDLRSGHAASFLYAISFFPIQNSHFFVVDVYLTFFVTALLYSLLLYLENPQYKRILLMAVFFAAAMATKITAIIFLPVTTLCIIWPLLTIRKNIFIRIKEIILNLLIFGVAALGFHFICMPYAYFSFDQFINQTFLQAMMNKNPYIFPYTLQYVYTTPYLYYLKNIFFWGLGPVISILAVTGIGLRLHNIIFEIKKLSSKHKRWFFGKYLKVYLSYLLKNKEYAVVTVFYLIYFVVIGHSAVKFMRYMLPLYPFFILLAGLALERIRRISKIGAIFLILLACIWTFSFLHIYSVEHSRITATKWILQNIPAGSSLAVEHWDDRLPLLNSENYRIQELTLYDLPDDIQKWNRINDVLASSDYIIIASNRLYVPLQKLTNCSKYLKCYPMTAHYYQRLFDGTLGFQKVAEFKDDPTIPLLDIYFSDQSADESFTVYDHPTIMIFERHRTGGS